MSRTIKGSKGPGYEYGSRRYKDTYMQPGRFSKKLTHRFERRNKEIPEIRQVHEDISSDGYPITEYWDYDE